MKTILVRSAHLDLNSSISQQLRPQMITVFQSYQLHSNVVIAWVPKPVVSTQADADWLIDFINRRLYQTKQQVTIVSEVRMRGNGAIQAGNHGVFIHVDFETPADAGIDLDCLVQNIIAHAMGVRSELAAV